MKKLAAIDIGTNSIKLLVAAVDETGVLEVLSREKSSVRLGSETLSTGRLAPEAIEAGGSPIEQFLRSVAPQEAGRGRARPTRAGREAENSPGFLDPLRRRTRVQVDGGSGR